MPPGAVPIIANGLSTDHPIPGLAFVNDSHIPVNNPDAIEAIGRGQGAGRHGRCDGGFERFGPDKQRQWWARTTEPDGNDLAWCVRYHPDHGRSVVLVRNEDAWTLHHDWEDDDGPLLFRSGGYWWDGTTWYRPMQVFDYATEHYARRQVAGATTITAADFLAATNNTPTSAAILTVADVHNAAHDGVPQAMTVDDWDPHLRLWAGRRRTTALPLSRCVVDLNAPELAADQLIGTPGLAARAGIGSSTLRAYVARGEAEIPAHQVTISGRNMWSKRVADDWAESRSRHPDNIDAALAATTELSVGKADLQQRFAARFLNRLWSAPFRKQWRLRDEHTAQQRANELGIVVATNLDDIIPIDAMRHTVQQAVIAQFQDTVALAKYNRRPIEDQLYLPMHTAILLDWIVRHYPSSAALLINDIIRKAQQLDIPQAATIKAIRRTLTEYGTAGDYETFLERALPPIAG